MTDSEKIDSSINAHFVYTVGIRRIQAEDLQKLLVHFQIGHIFDIRGAAQQRVPTNLKPANLAKLASKWTVAYHDETKSLGFRPDYQLFSFSDEFDRSMKQMSRFAKDSSVLIMCAETDYRKCHRKIVASFLARKGFPIRHLRDGLSTSFDSTLETIAHRSLVGRRMFTIGFTRKTMREFAVLLRDAKIKRVVDIRLRPVSQYSGFARKEDLEFLLELMGIEYFHALDFAPTPSLLDGYRSDENWTKYEFAFRNLLLERKPDVLLTQLLTPGLNVAFLCTEDTPERCHRRLVSEYAKSIFPDLEIVHLTSQGSYIEVALGGTSEAVNNAESGVRQGGFTAGVRNTSRPAP